MTVLSHPGTMSDRRPATKRRQQLFSWSNVLAGAYAAGLSFRVSFIGQLFLSELLSLVGVLFVKLDRLLVRYPVLKTILFGYAILLVSLMLSDLYNESLSDNYLRGWANIGFAAIDLVFLIALFDKNEKAFLAYLLCAAAARAVFAEQSLDFALTAENTNFFKIRFVPFLFPALLFLACILTKTNSRLAAALLGVGGVGFIVMDARSSGAALFVASLLLTVKWRNYRLSAATIVVFMSLFAAIGYFAYVQYVDYVLATQAIGSNSFDQLSRLANPYNPLELLLEGRTQSFVAIRAILDRPIVGFGSWAPDEYGTYSGLISQMRSSLENPAAAYQHWTSSTWIPAHSIVLTAWLWAGLGGFVGILIVFVAAIRQMQKAFPLHTYLMPAVYALSIEMIWNFLFSPIGHIRQTLPLVLAILIVLPARHAVRDLAIEGVKRSR